MSHISAQIKKVDAFTKKVIDVKKTVLDRADYPKL